MQFQCQGQVNSSMGIKWGAAELLIAVTVCVSVKDKPRGQSQSSGLRMLHLRTEMHKIC